jgi:hypothetical protein
MTYIAGYENTPRCFARFAANFLIERVFWVTAGFVAPLPISAGSSLFELLSL